MCGPRVGKGVTDYSCNPIRDWKHSLVFLGVVKPVADWIWIPKDDVGAGAVLLEMEVLAVEA